MVVSTGHLTMGRARGALVVHCSIHVYISFTFIGGSGSAVERGSKTPLPAGSGHIFVFIVLCHDEHGWGPTQPAGSGVFR